MEKKAKKIIQDYIDDFNSKINDKDNDYSKEEFVNNSSLSKNFVPFPISWFGDLEAYFKSNIKVLTVANNPSSAEFTHSTDDELEYFSGLKAKSKCVDTGRLYDVFNGYFASESYNHRWFNSLNSVLNQIGISYIQKKNEGKNIAIHTDFHSGIATDGWSGLPNKVKIQLANHNLFSELVEFLNPDLVIIFNDYFSMETLIRTINNGKLPDKPLLKLIWDKKDPLSPVLGTFVIQRQSGGNRKIIWVKNLRSTKTNLERNIETVKKFLKENDLLDKN